MSFLNLVSQVVLRGSVALGRAFVAAYRDAAKNAPTAAIASGTPQAGVSQNISDILTARTKLTFEEAHLILNTPKDASVSHIEKNFAHLFKANDKSVGGSFYLQSKVVCARERILLEMEAKGVDISEALQSKKVANSA